MRLARGELDRLITVARNLEPLHRKVVFLGGAVVGLLVTDPAGPPVRPTQDVDVVVEVATYPRYAEVEEHLRRLGFRHDQSEGAPLCRWLVEGIKVDVMPTDPTAIGFSNPWYAEAVRSAEPFMLEIGVTINLIAAPLFIATKFTAFKQRGEGDYLGSPDIEDIVTVVDGRPKIVDEVERTSGDARSFIISTCGHLLGERSFLDALPGHLGTDEAAQGRTALVLDRFGRISHLEVIP